MKYAHTNIIAKDYLTLSSFYQEVFDCKPLKPNRNLHGEWLDQLTGMKDVHIVGEHLLMPGYKTGGPTLEIFTYSDSTSTAKSINNCGFAHIAFEVESVAKAVDSVIHKGGALLGEIVTKDYGDMGIATFAYVKDPEGNLIELQSWQLENKSPSSMREKILNGICYTELVYQRISKKLNQTLSKQEIEEYIYRIISSSDSEICKKGKNYYITNTNDHVRITVNSFNYRVITADRI